MRASATFVSMFSSQGDKVVSQFFIAAVVFELAIMVEL